MSSSARVAELGETSLGHLSSFIGTEPSSSADASAAPPRKISTVLKDATRKSLVAAALVAGLAADDKPADPEPEAAVEPEASEPEGKICIICFDNPRTLRFGPCGHCSICDLCMLKLIGTQAREVQCPTCKTPIKQLALGAESSDDPVADTGAPVRKMVRRQPSFLQWSELPATEGKPISVRRFIAKKVGNDSGDEEIRAAAAAAKKAWEQAKGSTPTPEALLPIFLPPAVRRLVVLLAVALLGVWLWGLATATLSARQLYLLLSAGELQARVTTLDGFAGPVNALLHANQTCNATALCADALPDPSAHQRWWGLVPDGEVGELEPVWLMLWARIAAGTLLAMRGTSKTARALRGALANAPIQLRVVSSANGDGGRTTSQYYDGGQFGLLEQAGFDAVVLTTMLLSMFGVCERVVRFAATADETPLLVLGFFPAWAFFLVLVWGWGLVFIFAASAALTALSVQLAGRAQQLGSESEDLEELASIRRGLWWMRRGLPVAWVACLGSLVYYVFWLALPLLGYFFFFAWQFVDAVAAQPPRPSDGIDAPALAAPFAANVYLGLTCWLGAKVGSARLIRRHRRLLREDPAYRQARFAEANVPDPGPGSDGEDEAAEGSAGSGRSAPAAGGATEMV